MAGENAHSRKVCLAILVAAAGMAYAVNAYTWTGGGGNDSWTNPSNWGGGGYPNSSADTAEFNSSTTVSLDSGSTLTVGCVKVAANNTVTVNGTSGSALNPYKAAAIDGNGFVVYEGGKLVLNVPVVSSGRVDKWQSGDVVFNADVTITGNNYLLLDCGTTTLKGTATLSVQDGTLGLGNSLDRKQVTLNVTDSARVVAREVQTTAANNGVTGTGRIVQDGEGSEVYVSGTVTLSGAAGTAGKGVYELKSGIFTAGGVVSLGKSGTGDNGRVFGGGSFEQSGGRAVISNNFSVVRSDGSAIELSGGTLAFPNTTYYYTIGAPLALSGSPTIDVPSSGTVTLPSETTFAFGTSLTKTGGGTLFAKSDLAAAGSFLVDGGAFLVDEPYNSSRNVEIHALHGDETPWPVTLRNNGCLQISLINKRVTRPLALTVETGGNVRFANVDGENPLFARSILVAHTLVVDGVSKSKGRYTKDNLAGIFSGDSAPFASVVVPYVWIGSGDGTNWNDPANWDGGIVPPSGSGTCVDISRAAGRNLVLDADVTLSCLVFNPQGSVKKLTISGSGKIIHDCPTYTVGMFIGPGREIAFDVDVEKPAFGVSNFNSPTIVGGGRVTVKKGFPGTTRDDTAAFKRPGYVLDGELAFAGKTRFLGEETFKCFGIGTWENAGHSRIVFDEGCDVEAHRIDPSPLRNIVASDEWVQNGGSLSMQNFYFTSYYSKRRTPFSYTLNSGIMTIAGEFCLGSAYYTAERRYPGGDFEMNGGTLTLGEFRSQRNDNHIRLNGGDVFLKNGFKDTFAAGQLATNDLSVSIGGATIHSTAAWTSTLAMEFSGRNGSATFDTAGFNAAFYSPVSGVGGLVKNGAGILTFSGAVTFTGPVVVNGGSVVFGSTVDGPTDFTVRSGTLSFQTAPADELDSIIVPSASDLVVSASASGFSVKRLVVAGVPHAAGSVSVNGGTVNVTGTDLSVWQGLDAGNWSAAANWTAGVPNGADAEVDFGFSALAAESSVGIDTGITLKNLSYSHGTEGASLTLAGVGGLTFASGGAITVPSGNTLVIDANVTLLGETVKKGLGTLIVNGDISSAGSGDTYWLIVEEGDAKLNGAVSKCRLRIESGVTTPLLTVGEHAVVSNSVSVNPGWGGKTGAVVQNGGVVDMNPPTQGFVKSGFWAMAYGAGRYTLNGGVFSFFIRSRFLWTRGDKFDFVQNGGILKVDVMGYDERAGDITYTLNGGTNEIATSWSANAAGRNTVYLNGGTIVSGGNAAMFSSDFNIVFGGDVTFMQKSADVSVALGPNVTGSGTICQAGPGTLALASPLGPDFSVDIASGGKLSIGSEEVVVRRLSVNGQERRAGRYSATGVNLGGRIVGAGDLVVLEGSGPGMIISIR